ncbi:unnamed protein product, partial [Porites evermanni]
IAPYDNASSAQSLTVELRPLGKSFIYIKNSNSPKTVRWGTPDVVTTGANDAPSITTDWVSCVRNDSNQSSGICPNNWIRLKGSCYKVSSGSTNWNAAKSACEAMGSKLAILTSQAEQQALASKISQDVWIGLHRDPNDNSRWMWVDGSRTTYTHWSNREPNDHGGNEDCTYMFPPAGKWNDSPCSHGRQYLCETKGR